MRYAGLDFLYKPCDLKIFEYGDVYICTTFKIGTRSFSDTTNLINGYDLMRDDIHTLFRMFDKNKKIYIVIKNPVNRFISGATQTTFEGATQYTAAYSLAKWGSESHFFREVWPQFVKGGIDNSTQIYSQNFDSSEFENIESSISVWKTWLDIVHFNIRMGDAHLSQYHKHCYQNFYKVLKNHHDIEIIEDTELMNHTIFKNITNTNLPPRTHTNSKWNGFLKQNIIYDVDDTLPRVSINPFLITENAVEIEDYITEEFRYYNKLKNLIKHG